MQGKLSTNPISPYQKARPAGQKAGQKLPPLGRCYDQQWTVI